MDDRDIELYRSFGTDLLRLATMLVGPADAEDIVTEAMIDATHSTAWSGLDDDARRGYLYRSVVNRGKQWERSRRRRERRELLLAARDASVHLPICPAPEVWAAVMRLDARARAVIYLTYWSDLDGEAVAAALGISVRSVRRDLAGARQKLRRSIDVSAFR